MIRGRTIIRPYKFMPIFTALSTFENKPLDKDGVCTFCKRFHPQGTAVFWKTYKAKFRQISRVILCDEDCHAGYDQNFWETRIRRNKPAAAMTDF